MVCFSCLTPYHVFVSYILSKTVYKHHYKVILFSDHYHREIYQRALKLKIWDKIILVEEKNKSLDFIYQQLNQIDLNHIDVLHYFSWGSIFQLLLIDCIPNHIKLIMTDEGVGTYYIKEAVDHWKNKYSPHRNPIDFHKVSEIWLFDKRLYVSSLEKPLKDIDFKKCLEENIKFELCRELNILFGYAHEKKDWDILFFDQPLSLAHITSIAEEKNLLMRIVEAGKDYKLLVKKHPTDHINKYAGLNLNILQCSDIPWEIVYLNEYIQNNSIMQNKIYMTYNSTALLNTRILFKDLDNSNRFLVLNKLLSKYTDTSQANSLLKKYFEKFKEFYGNNYYELETLEELESILQN